MHQNLSFRDWIHSFYSLVVGRVLLLLAMHNRLIRIRLLPTQLFLTIFLGSKNFSFEVPSQTRRRAFVFEWYSSG